MSDQHQDDVPREDDATQTEPVAEQVGEELAPGEKFTPEKLGDAAIKFATETVYAAAGLANVIAEKARELYEAQRKQIAEHSPEGVDPNFRQFVDAMPEQFKTLMDEATKAYRDLAERGRTTVTDLQNQVQSSVQAARATAREPQPEAFDLNEDASATGEAADVVAPDESVAPEDTTDVHHTVHEDGEFPGESKSEHRP